MRSVSVLFVGAALFLGACVELSSAQEQRPTRPGSLPSSPAQSYSSPKNTQSRPPAPARAPAKAKSVVPAPDYVPVASLLERHGLGFTWTERDRAFRLSGPGHTLSFEVDSRECEIDGMRVFLGDAVRLRKGIPHFSRIDRDALLSPILRPGHGQKRVPPLRTIMLDPGHGGSDSGMTNHRLKLQEKVLTLDTVQRLRRLLEKRGYVVRMTRSTDQHVPLADRAFLADEADADLFVSVHFNSVESGAETVTGVEVFTMTPRNQLSVDQKPDPVYAHLNNPGNQNDHWNSILGHFVHKELRETLQVPDRGLKRSRFAVLRLASCPAVLVESGYLSNDAEARKLAKPEYRQRIAEGLAEGIERYATALEAARRTPR